MRIEVKVIGSKGLKRKLRKMQRKLKDPSRANRSVSIWLLRWVNQNFKTEGGGVRGWKPFKHGGRVLPGGQIDSSAKLLQDTGRLRASFHPFHSRKVAGVGSNLDYSLTHHMGLPHRSLPARRLIPFGGDRVVEGAILKIYQKYIDGALR